MLLAFDLDNTVVTKDHRLPAEIRDAIFAARAAGHLVSVLTGRTRASAQPYLDELEVTGPYSVNHGALVVGPGGDMLFRAQLATPTPRRLLDAYGERPGIEPSCIVGDTLYVRRPGDVRWAWAHTLDQEVLPLHAYDGDHADKVVFHCPDVGRDLHQEIRDEHPDLVLYLWQDGFLEVTGAGGHKGAALERIARALGVPRDQTVAFGDGVNDVTMLEWAGHAVAVGPHAYPEVLAAADEHIASPEELGVARWLEANALGAVVRSA